MGTCEIFKGFSPILQTIDEHHSMEFGSDSATSDASMGLAPSDRASANRIAHGLSRRRRMSTECSDDSGVMAREMISFQEIIQRKSKPSNVAAEMALSICQDSVLGQVRKKNPSRNLLISEIIGIRNKSYSFLHKPDLLSIINDTTPCIHYNQRVVLFLTVC